MHETGFGITFDIKIDLQQITDTDDSSSAFSIPTGRNTWDCSSQEGSISDEELHLLAASCAPLYMAKGIRGIEEENAHQAKLEHQMSREPERLELVIIYTLSFSIFQ